MPVDIQGTGTLGLAFEATAGTYVAPTKFFPILSESLQYQQETVYRRPIRGIVDVVGAVAGNSHIEGDVQFECTEDVLPYFLYAGRWTVTKTGTTDLTYTAVPFHGALPTSARTLSLTVVRQGTVFGYLGCVVGSLAFTLEDGLLVCTASIVGRDEATQSAPAPTFGTVVPFGMGQYSVQIPTASQVFDTDTFNLSIEDNAEPQFRLHNTSRAPRYVKFGERAVELSVERDFDGRTDYDAFKALTAQGVTILASKGALNSIQFLVPAGIKDTYEVSGLGSQGDLVRASVQYNGVYNAGTTRSVEIVVKTQESIA